MQLLLYLPTCTCTMYAGHSSTSNSHSVMDYDTSAEFAKNNSFDTNCLMDQPTMESEVRIHVCTEMIFVLNLLPTGCVNWIYTGT